MISFRNLRCCRISLLRQALMAFLVVQIVGVSKVVHCFHVPSIAFQQQQLPTIQQLQPMMRKNIDSSCRRIFSKLNMINPEQVHDLFVTTSTQHGLEIPSHYNHIITELNTAISTSRTASELTQWISDSGTTAATSTSQVDGGWWNAYINVFKSILSFVHSTVDGPLRSVGIEQTWGVSIFLFTASKCNVCAELPFMNIIDYALTSSLNLSGPYSHPISTVTIVDPTIEKR
jgi:hypothetical protein